MGQLLRVVLVTMLFASAAFAQCNADQYAGSDIGAKINNAYATGACPVIMLTGDAYSSYTAATFSVSGRPVLLKGNGAAVSYLGSGPFISYNPGQTHVPEGGLEDITLIGNPAATALSIGGTNGGDGFIARNTRICGFGAGVNFNSNVYNVMFEHVVFSENIQAVNIGTGLTNFGEQILFSHVAFSNTQSSNFTNCFVITAYTGLTLEVNDSLLDNCQVVINNNGSSGQLANVTFFADHFEDPNFPLSSSFIVHNGGANLYLDGVDFMDEKGASSVPYAISATGGGSTHIDAVRLFTGNNTGALVNLEGSSHRLIVNGPLYHTVTPGVSAIPPWANANALTTTWMWADTDLDNIAQTSGIFDFRTGSMGPGSARFRLGNINGAQALFSMYEWTGVGSNFYSYALKPSANEIDFCEGGAAAIGTETYTCNIRFTQGGMASFPGGISTGSSGSMNRVVCWKDSTHLGSCASQPDATGSCTCE